MLPLAIIACFDGFNKEVEFVPTAELNQRRLLKSEELANLYLHMEFTN